MGRRPKYTVTDTQMRNLILKYGIDSEGLKVPLRELYSNPEFMDKTGYYELNMMGVKTPVSLGSVSDLNTKLKTKAEDMYKHYVKKGLVTVSLDEWLKMSVKKTRKKYSTGEIKSFIISFFGLSYDLMCESTDTILIKAREYYLSVGLTDEDYEKDFESFLKSNGLNYRSLTRLNNND